jgi:ADP-heptose:LPS heptosyltransferase
MISFLNKKIPKQYSFLNWFKGLVSGQIKKYFFKFAKIFYTNIYTPNIVKPKKGKLLIVSEVGGLGDAILFRRVLEGIKNNYEIYLLTKNYHFPVYQDIIPADKLIKISGLADFFKTSKKLSKEKFDILLLHELSVASFLSTLIYFRKIPFKIGIFSDQGEGFLNKNFRNQDYKNVLELYSASASYLGGQYKLYSFEKYQNAPKTNQVLIHIGSNSLCKNWRIANFLEFFQMLDKVKIKYKIIGSDSDFKVLGASLKEFKQKVLVIKSFDELVTEIAQSEIILCHNTSVLHLAFALGVKTVSLNSKSNYDWWNPYKDFPGRRHFAFKASDKECGYSQHIKTLLIERKKYGCSLFDSIEPQAVFNVVQKLINIINPFGG